MKRVVVPTYTVAIYVGGDLNEARWACRRFCSEIGLCVTVEPVGYYFAGGWCEGVRVGLINYGRFPAMPEEIFAKAEALAVRLIDELRQQSASIVATDRTVWLSNRPDDISTPIQGSGDSREGGRS